MFSIMRLLLRSLLRVLYRVEVKGVEHFHEAGPRVLIVANHTSFLDAVLLALFLPDKLTFAVNTEIAKRWYARMARFLVHLFPMNPMSPLATKSLIKYLKEDRKAVIFPEGRITVTGALMKIYQGPGLVADKSAAMVLPVRIEGAQYTPFSRLRGRIRLRWFPKITLTLLAPRRLTVPDAYRGRARRIKLGTALDDLMTDMMFTTAQTDSTLIEAVLNAQAVYGSDHIIAEDIQRQPLSYRQLLTRALILGKQISHATQPGEAVGLLLPNMTGTVVAFLGAQFYGRVPAMLNFTVGASGLLSACETACINTVYTSRRFVETGKLDKAMEALSATVSIVYLEDVAAGIGLWQKLTGLVQARFARQVYRATCRQCTSNSPAVILFTSGSEGTPKGVVLSHRNILSNRQQFSARVDFNSQDVILNALPLFHSFGLSAGTILPLLAGIKTFFYPSPLHYRIVPEMAYDINATIMFGTNTFLAGYARFAHPYDFYSIRYVFAGAEKLKDEVRQVWQDKFGVRIFEGYGATETSPGLATNTAMANRPGTVGRLLPHIEFELMPVPGVSDGGRLYVSGPNIMLGYLLHDNPGVLVPPVANDKPGWYDTGDIVAVDDTGFITILGRAKRFAKVGGEMISLTVVEALASQTWPECNHAVAAVPDSSKGEQLVLLTEHAHANRADLLAQARSAGIGELAVPKKIIHVKSVPLLGTGKIDYGAVQTLVIQELSHA